MNFDCYYFIRHSAHVIDKNFASVAKALKAVDKKFSKITALLCISQLCLLAMNYIQESQIEELEKKVGMLAEDNRDLNMAVYGGSENDTAEDKDVEM